MPAILRNDDAEALILDIRVARTANTQVIPPAAAAFLTFTTSVVLKGSRRGHLVFPLDCEVEPGRLVTTEGSARVTATVAGVTVAGEFRWTVGQGPPLPATYRFRRRGREVTAPPWVSQLPESQLLAPEAPAALTRQQGRLRRRGRDAEHCLLRLTEGLLRQSCRGSLDRGLQYRPPIDADDLVQRGLQSASRLLPVYASKDRPPCSWLGMLRLDARRDVRRELTRLDWLPVDAVAALALAETCGVDLMTDPVAGWNAVADVAERLRRPVPRIDAAQLDLALRAPARAEHAFRGALLAPGPETETERDADPGRVATTVARLVTSDPGVIAGAGEGDAAALGRVASQVRRRLTGARRSTAMVRQQMWDEFRASGQLFATPAGIASFHDLADIETLAAIDECLLRAAGLRPTAAR